MMTPRQKHVFDYLVDCQRRGVSPSLQEVADAVGLRSKGNVGDIVRQLCERGMIRKVHHKHRSIYVPMQRVKYFVFNDETKALEPMEGQANAKVQDCRKRVVP